MVCGMRGCVGGEGVWEERVCGREGVWDVRMCEMRWCVR